MLFHASIAKFYIAKRALVQFRRISAHLAVYFFYHSIALPRRKALHFVEYRSKLFKCNAQKMFFLSRQDSCANRHSLHLLHLMPLQMVLYTFGSRFFFVLKATQVGLSVA